MITTILLTVTHTKPLPDLTDMAAGRVYCLDGVEDVTADVVNDPPKGFFGLVSPDCWCEACDVEANHGLRTRMSVCPSCGDKRCSMAAHHGFACDK